VEATVRTTRRTEPSPRHVPDHLVFVGTILRNPNGKRLEIPPERVVRGAALGDVLDAGVVHPDDVLETTRRVGRVLQPA